MNISPKNRNHNRQNIDNEDDHFEAMPIRQSMNTLIGLTAPSVRDEYARIREKYR